MVSFYKNLTMYRLMLYYLRVLIAAAVVLSFFDVLPYTWWHILLTALYMPLACWIFNWIFARLFQVKTNFESQFITGSILTLIVGPLNPLTNLLFLTVVAAVAMASKYLLVYKKSHVFNPAAVGVVVSLFVLQQGASWWVGNIYLLPILLIGGFLILRKLRWFHLAISFLISYLVLLPLSIYLRHLNLDQALSLNFPTLISPLLFFATVMLIEPLTAPPTKRLRIYYGIGVALILILLNNFAKVPYSLELSLLMGNLAIFLINPKQNIGLKLAQTDDIAAHTKGFWFTPIKKFQFQPGQFLEWSLPHSKPDNRGTRRWFTIASSPTEEKILLATKLFEKPSTFKQALAQLEIDGDMTAIKPDGDFILPKNTNKKLVFIAGGIGITPFRSMIKYLLDSDQQRNIVLLYSAKTADEFAFRDIFDQAKKIGVNAVYIATDEQGFITAQTIKTRIPDWQERSFYVSGPEPMVEAFEKMLGQMGIKNHNIKRDYFPGYTETYN